MPKLEPVNLEELWKWFEKKFGEDALNRVYIYEINELINEIKRRVKLMCKFYMRYKDRPDLFEKEQKDLIDYDTWDFRHHTFVILKGNRASEYNLWLFKVAFKDILS